MSSQVFTESFAFFKGLKLAFCSFDAPFGSILKKYRSFATVHYSLVATSALFAELKQLKANCHSERQHRPMRHLYFGGGGAHTITM